MPTLLNWKGHKFLFYSKEIGEPPHVHVLKDKKQLKVWLSDLRVARNAGFAAHEVNAILAVIAENRAQFLETWNDYFGH
ncbi:DUF4160 domain-containing protein [Rhizobium sp. L1K21]|uniref:DUF4160 domain-containing protein n=1 Tax=Rhizobium sp. L1K21 TaxID=2954933 RepID=UPI002092ECC6|nr:DUF4160 domain-containing protein [Rhizobium sp. L1K21]MCO6187204.1 DUF4160 domain-containing protein [Rhizobium sp. L1K21]